MKIEDSTVYVNAAAGLVSLECPPDAATRISAEGWTVVNAPRPLGGAFTWEGPYRAGVFYATGPEAHWDGLWGWKALDAWRVVLVTNEEIRAHLEEVAKECDYTLAQALEFSTMRELAAQEGLPWHEEKESNE